MTIPARLTPLAALLLLACTDGIGDEVPQADIAIRYNVTESPSGTVSRSIPLTTLDGVFPYSRTFTVYAYTGNETLIGGEEVKWRGWFWSTEENHYWPSDASAVDFYGICPDSVTVDAVTAGSTILTNVDFNVTQNLAAQTDLLVCKAVNQVEPSQRDVGVALDFRHALARISFEARLAEDAEEQNWTVEISSLRLCNIYSSGTFSYQTMTWGGCTANADYPVGLTADKVVITSREATALSASDGAPMLIAQSHDPWDTANESVDGMSPALGATTVKPQTAGSYIAVDLHISRDITGTEDLLGTADSPVTAYAPITPDWEPGRHYTYTLELGGGLSPGGSHWLTYLGITATITPWGEGASQSGTAGPQSEP